MPDRTPIAVIAEDEPLLADELRELLAELWPKLSIVAVVGDGVSALQTIEERSPDVAFLDIRMPRLSGLEVARRVSSRCRIAFISAYDQHAIEAFEAGGIDYVLKPLSSSRLLTTIERLRDRLDRRPADLQSVLQQLGSAGARTPKYLQWINTSSGSTVRLLTVSEILYFKADNKYTLVVTPGSESVIRKTIRELCDELDPTHFWQVHRSTIVNVHAIDRLLRDSRGGLSIRLAGREESLLVSTQYHSLFRQM